MLTGLFDSHMHTPLCKHALGEPEEYARAGVAAGLSGIIFTCHNPAPEGFSPYVRMGIDEFDRYVAIVDRARAAFAGQIEVRLGLESDFFPGHEPWLEKLHTRAEFHYILGSVHSHLPEYRAAYFKGDPLAFQRQYFTHLAEAAETGLFDALAHPDLVKNCFPKDWQLPRLLDDIRAALDRIARTGIAMELNTSGLYKHVQEMNPGREILREIALRSIPIVLGSDSHKPERVADQFAPAMKTLQECGFTHISVFEHRKRRDLPLSGVQSAPLAAAI
jgi:histidinol-phosphatase (PHP family)